jgi:hypothetical protein
MGEDDLKQAERNALRAVEAITYATESPGPYVTESLRILEPALAEWLARPGFWASPNECELTRPDLEMLTTVHLLLMAMRSAADGGDGAFGIQWKRRTPGRPGRSREAVMRGHRAATRAENLIREGLKVDSAVARAAREHGLAKSDVYAWMENHKKLAKRAEALRARSTGFDSE